MALLNTCGARSRGRKVGEELFPWSPVIEAQGGWLDWRGERGEGGGRSVLMGGVRDEGTSLVLLSAPLWECCCGADEVGVLDSYPSLGFLRE